MTIILSTPLEIHICSFTKYVTSESKRCGFGVSRYFYMHTCDLEVMLGSLLPSILCGGIFSSIYICIPRAFIVSYVIICECHP